MRMRRAGLGRLVLGACAVACAGALAVGCTPQTSRGVDAEVAQRLERIEGELSELREMVSELEAGVQGAQEVAQDPSEPPVPQASESHPELDDFETRVAELEERCATATRSDDRSTNYQAYLDLKYEMDALEHEMDAYEDEWKHAARSGDASYEEYREVERAVDRLDDRLDHAEDGLELTLGVDD